MGRLFCCRIQGPATCHQPPDRQRPASPVSGLLSPASVFGLGLPSPASVSGIRSSVFCLRSPVFGICLRSRSSASGHQPDTSRTPAGHQPDTSQTPAGHQPPDACNLPARRQPPARAQRLLSSASVFGICLQAPVSGLRSPVSGLRQPASGLPGACVFGPASSVSGRMPAERQRPASGTPKVLHPYGVVVVVAHPPLGLYIRIF